MTRATIAAVTALLISGCSEPSKSVDIAARHDVDDGSLIGKTVLVTDSGVNLSGYPVHGKILTVDPNKRKPVWLPEYVPSFRAVVIADVPTEMIDGEPYPACWRVRPEEGPAAFQVVDVVKAETVLTVLK